MEEEVEDYARGFKEGYNKGHLEGYDEGLEDSEEYDKGFEDGKFNALEEMEHDIKMPEESREIVQNILNEMIELLNDINKSDPVIRRKIENLDVDLCNLRKRAIELIINRINY